MSKPESTQQSHEETKLPRAKFPHYTRLFSALPIKRLLGGSGKAFLWIFLILSILTNLALTNMSFGSWLYQTVRRVDAYAWFTQKDTSVLGTSNTQVVDATTLQNKYDYWQNIIQKHPDYRDGYYMAAILAYQQGNYAQSRGFLEKVKNLDPNFVGIQLMETLVAEK